MKSLTILSEGIRIFRLSRARMKRGLSRYRGDPAKICRQIIENCWNSRYFQTSTHNFAEFWVRDFGFCAESLVKLGYRDKVSKTLEYALSIFEKNKKITTTITPKGKPIDIYSYSPDSLPLLVRTIKIVDDRKLFSKYKNFLQKELYKYYKIVIDKKTGLVKKKKFSSMKDYSIRKSSCYDNCMAAMMNSDLQELNKKNKLKLTNPLKNTDFKQLIKQNFWHNGYFLDDLSGSTHVAGDANTFPYWCGLFDPNKNKENKDMLKSSIKNIQKYKLDYPFPLKYTNVRLDKQKMSPQEIFVRDYETNSIWIHMGLAYIEVVKKVDRKLAKKYVDSYTELINKYGTFLEVFDKNAQPFRTPFYLCDEGMLWCSSYLNLIKN
ncbi:hypothetical protein ACFL0W_00580 [Nanoarchaeota archaeon]